MITKQEIEKRREKFISLEEKMAKHSGCPRCKGTMRVVRPIDLDPREYDMGMDVTNCDYYGATRKTERELASFGIAPPSMN